MSALNFARIDAMAIAGYDYAAGIGKMPKLEDQMDLDAFNVGARQWNDKNNGNVNPLFIVTTRHNDGANSRIADKELAIVGAGS